MDLQNQGIVLIADYIENHALCNIYNNDLECPSYEYFSVLKDTLNDISSQVSIYRSPQQFIDNIQKHKNDIVLSIWSGTNSKYRKAVVPTICEAYEIKYVGADPYLQFIAQDKNLSKLYCKEFNIQSAKGVHIKNPRDYILLKDLNYPIIVKPNSEGGSNGISQNNIVNNYDEALLLCEKLLPNFQNDLLAEEFIFGKEITVVLFGNTPDNFIMKQNEIIFGTDNVNKIWGYESKKQGIVSCKKQPIDVLDNYTKQNFKKMFFSFKKAELMRVDGKVYNNNFYMIEITPDASIDPSSSVSYAFKQLNKSYKEMLEMILINTINYYQLGNANMKDSL